VANRAVFLDDLLRAAVGQREAAGLARGRLDALGVSGKDGADRSCRRHKQKGFFRHILTV
jgi:hypothetical protein